MVEGSIMIYDINLLNEKHYLDKHKSKVVSLEWGDNWNLISAGQDGMIHIYDILDGNLKMKR